MKKLLALTFFSLFIYGTQAQVMDHTQEKWSVSKKKIAQGETLDLIFTVEVSKDWYIYSTEFDAIGPLPTEFSFTEDPSYELVGKVQAIQPKTKYDEIWEGNVAYHQKKAEFRQTIKILQENPNIQGEFSFQTCSNVTGQCLPPESVEFLFTGQDIQVIAQAQIETVEPPINKTEVPQPESPQEDPGSKEIEEQEVDDNQDGRIDEEDSVSATEPDDKVEEKEKEEAASTSPQTRGSGNTPDTSSGSLWIFALEAFFWGFFALLTPCVFPMIPMTVSFFTKQSKTRQEGITKGVIYGLSIVLIYTILGVIFSRIFGPAFNNWLSTHWVPNIFFFLLLVVFGLSFLGAFEIVLPSAWVNRSDQQADKGGYYGIFFMAFTLALVSFSCTAPIVGTVLVQSAGGQWIKPIIGMVAFSSALALPFALFAIFPSWLQSLPHSGGWLNSVKVTLGFLELALSLKFLSVADQVYHWGILDRDVFLALWVVIFGMLGFYFLGKIRLPNDSPIERLSVGRAMLAMFSLSFVVYLIPGLFGAPLKPLAGYLPPLSTLDGFNLAQNTNYSTKSEDFPPVKYADFLHLPHQLQGFFDYEEGLAYAKKVNKPIFIDFTGHGCVNCREMEARVWSEPQVLKRLQQDYVVIALYVDDKTKLPEEDWQVSEYDGRTKKTIGALNANFQIERFNNNAQPYYCLLNHQGQLLRDPIAYELNVSKFVNFLDAGLEDFQKKNEVVASRN